MLSPLTKRKRLVETLGNWGRGRLYPRSCAPDCISETLIECMERCWFVSLKLAADVVLCWAGYHSVSILIEQAQMQNLVAVVLLLFLCPSVSSLIDCCLDSIHIFRYVQIEFVSRSLVLVSSVWSQNSESASMRIVVLSKVCRQLRLLGRTRTWRM